MKTIDRILAAAALFTLSFSLAAQQHPAEGDWLGILKVQGMSLRVVFHIARSAEGAWAATMDSPDQGARGIAVDNVAIDGRSVTLTSSMIRGEYRGTMQPGDSTIDGTWSQSGVAFPLSLTRTSKPVTINRPQDPRPPLPYTEEEVTVRNEADGITLAGTLSIPAGAGPFPGVVLVTGSGPQDRNETVFGHRPFLVIADHLARNGIAVLRCDDRGIGGSTGSFKQATSEDFSRDAEAAAAYLRARPEVHPDKVGIIGHSEGGLIAPMVASRSGDIAFIVLLAGPSITGERIILLQDSLISVASGLPKESIRRSLEANRTIFNLLRTEADTAALRARLRTHLRSVIAADPDTTLDAAATEAAIDRNLAQLLSPWFRFFAFHDPYPVLTRVSCPVLALNGEKDLQVPSRVNLDGIAAALKEGGNQTSTVRELPGLNHLFQTAGTGAPAEYASIEETFSPTALELITAWIGEVTAGH